MDICKVAVEKEMKRRKLEVSFRVNTGVFCSWFPMVK